MKKNKLFPLISILILLSLFGTAAICNQCTITPTTETKVTAAGESNTTETVSETTQAQETTEETTSSETQTSETLTEKPYANNFSLLDLDKNKVSLSDFQGKVVVLNFWATWCPPCKAEIPDFVEVYSIYKTKSVQFLGISNDDVKALIKFVQENKINYPILVDGSIDTIMPKWGIEAIPTTFIFNGNGKVLFHNVGMMTKDQLINAIEKSLSVSN